VVNNGTKRKSSLPYLPARDYIHRTVWEMIEYHNTHHKPILPLEGRYDFKGKCEVLCNALFPMVNTKQQTPLPATLLTCKKDLCHYTQEVTVSEIHLAVTLLKYGTSVRSDDTTYSTLRHFNKATPHLLPDLFTACLRHATYSPEWKTANCVVVLKPCKKSYSHPKSY